MIDLLYMHGVVCGSKGWPSLYRQTNRQTDKQSLSHLKRIKWHSMHIAADINWMRVQSTISHWENANTPTHRALQPSVIMAASLFAKIALSIYLWLQYTHLHHKYRIERELDLLSINIKSCMGRRGATCSC